MLDRRRFVIGSCGVLLTGATAAGALGIAALGDKYGFFGSIVRRNLPGIPLDDAEIRQFVDAYWPGFLARYGPTKGAGRRVVVALDAMLPGETAMTEAIERDVLTQFLMGSNFFQLTDPSTDAIRFLDLASACSNPFART